MAGLYSYKWQQARLVFLKENPLCVRCDELKIIKPSTVVDHIIPHEEDLILFWKRSNWQALCKPCHDSHKQRFEKSGIIAGCNHKGIPTDPNHHWNRK